jgi:simple sugar transport system permease protein
MIKTLKKFPLNDTTVRLLIFAVILVVFGLINPTVVSFTNLVGLVNNSVYLGIAGLGLMTVMITGSFDMSSTGIALISFYATAAVYRALDYQGDYVSGFLLAGAIGIGCALISMTISVVFDLSGFVVSLGYSLVLSSGLFIFVKGYISEQDMPHNITRLSYDNIFSIPMPDGTRASLGISVILLVSIAVIIWIILNRTQLGRGIYALGSDKTALERVGYNVNAVYILAYSIFGFCNGVAGMIFYANMAMAEPGHILKTTMDIIAVAIFGGCNLKDGKGMVGGILAAVFIITLINNNLVILGISPFMKTLIVGLALLVSVFLSSIRDIRARRA